MNYVQGDAYTEKKYKYESSSLSLEDAFEWMNNGIAFVGFSVVEFSTTTERPPGLSFSDEPDRFRYIPGPCGEQVSRVKWPLSEADCEGDWPFRRGLFLTRILFLNRL